MRRTTVLVALLGLALATSVVAAAPKGLGEMSAEEVREEVHRLYCDDLPYWAKLNPRLKETASAEPLEFTDFKAIKERAETRLGEIERRQAAPSTNKSTP